MEVKKEEEKIYPEFKDFFERGQAKREKKSDHEESGIVVTPDDPESQEWHAREDIEEEKESFHDNS
ncbi:MAG TPA: hypothetical protein VKY27_06390 [Bacteriovoracaceae bacterium]|nr:hypothetical protein [Bacteriovoracaceae bacterium]